jgi:hypothetical protein
MFGDGRIVFDASDIDVDIQVNQVAYEDPSAFIKKMDISGMLGRKDIKGPELSIRRSDETPMGLYGAENLVRTVGHVFVFGNFGSF